MLSNIFKTIFALLCIPFFGNALTLEEKVGQLLIVRFEGHVANLEAEKLIREAHVGGFIYYPWANGLNDPSQVKLLSESLQKLSSIPLWICIDQEGGPVSRLGEGFPTFLGNREIAQTQTPSFAQQQAYNLGKHLRSVGINVNLAPVVDVSGDPHSFIAKRTYGNDPAIVTEFAYHALLGYTQAGILAVMKHFPGCGDAQIDPHQSVPILSKSIEELEQKELYPFKKLHPYALGIMTTHIQVPSLDPFHCATLSHAITTGILRKNWSYQGLILSDSLVMGGLLDICPSIEEIAIRALEAGCDLLLFGGRQLEYRLKDEVPVDAILRVHKAIVRAVQKGRIPLSRIEESVERNLHFKKYFL